MLNLFQVLPEDHPRDEPHQSWYAAYRASDHWKRVRARVISRALHRCQDCGAWDTVFEVHHLTYENLGTERDEDLVALCPTCHGQRHRATPLSAEIRPAQHFDDDIPW